MTAHARQQTEGAGDSRQQAQTTAGRKRRRQQAACRRRQQTAGARRTHLRGHHAQLLAARRAHLPVLLQRVVDEVLQQLIGPVALARLGVLHLHATETETDETQGRGRQRKAGEQVDTQVGSQTDQRQCTRADRLR